MAPLISLGSLWTLTFTEVNRAKQFGIIYRSWPVCLKIRVRLGTAENITLLWTPLMYTGGPKITIRSALLWKKHGCWNSNYLQEGMGEKKGKKMENGCISEPPAVPRASLAIPKSSISFISICLNITSSRRTSTFPSAVRESLGLCPKLLWQNLVGCNPRRGRWSLHLLWISWAGLGGEELKVSTLQWQTTKRSRQERNSMKQCSWRLQKRQRNFTEK